MTNGIAFYAITYPLHCCGSMQIISPRGVKTWHCAVCDKPAPAHLAKEATLANEVFL